MTLRAQIGTSLFVVLMVALLLMAALFTSLLRRMVLDSAAAEAGRYAGHVSELLGEAPMEFGALFASLPARADAPGLALVLANGVVVASGGVPANRPGAEELTLAIQDGHAVVTRENPASTRTFFTTATPVSAGALGDAHLVVALPLDDAFARARALNLSLLAYLVLDLFAAFAVAWILLGRAVVQPLRRLLPVVEAARPGTLAVLDAVEREAPGKGGELGQLARTLKQMGARIEHDDAELRALQAELVHTREAVAEAERLAAVGRLAAGVAHEIGNPLGAVVGYIELARRAAERPEEAREILGYVDTELQRIDRLIRELLDFARPMRLRPTAVDLAPLVADVARLLAADKRGATLRVVQDLAPGLPAVGAEHDRLAQVLLNLGINAADAVSESGRPGTLRVWARVDADNVLLHLDDDGPGIPDTVLEHLFEPFFTTKAHRRGTGLGLAVCRRIVEGYGGAIHAWNRAEGGARLTLVLPIWKGD